MRDSHLSERRSVPNIDLGARFVRGQDKLLVVAETRRQLLCAHRAARVAAVRPIASPSMQTINRTDAECIAEHAQRLARPARGPCNMQQRTSETRFNLANSLCARSRAERALMIATTIPINRNDGALIIVASAHGQPRPSGEPSGGAMGSDRCPQHGTSWQGLRAPPQAPIYHGAHRSCAPFVRSHSRTFESLPLYRVPRIE